MCISLFSTAHPRYAFILASNRDVSRRFGIPPHCIYVDRFSAGTNSLQEFLTRPTAPADWWDAPDEHVLGGRDLEREIRGTWLGINKQGRIASLTNFRESGSQAVSGLKSRGAIVVSFLTTRPEDPETTAEAARRIVEREGVQDVGGFSLLFGRLRRPDEDGRTPGLAIISNRTPDMAGLTWVAKDRGEIHGLSNSHFGDKTWPKVNTGCEHLRRAIQDHALRSGATETELVDRLFEVLSVDTLPKRVHGQTWDSYVLELRHSVFIPKVGGDVQELDSDRVHAAASKHVILDKEHDNDLSGVYATQKQTIILVDLQGNVTFIEKTLHVKDGNFHHGSEDIKRFSFQIEDW